MRAYQQELQDCLPTLWRYAFSLTRSRDQADDLVQDCAERALRKRRLWQPTGPLKPWLMKMLLNLYRNQIRAGKSRPQTTAMQELTHEPVAADVLSDKLALTDTARALTTLPENQREVILLIVLGGISYKDAAAALNIPIGTLMSRLGRARAKLREVTGQVVQSPERQGVS